MPLSFKKEERLCSRKLIEQLYAEGHRLMAFPYSVQWLVVDTPLPADQTPCQVLIVAPKRKFHHAVDRNRVKRLTRECYRLHKTSLYSFLSEHHLRIVFSMVYIHHEIMPYELLAYKMEKLLTTMEKEIMATL